MKDFYLLLSSHALLFSSMYLFGLGDIGGGIFFSIFALLVMVMMNEEVCTEYLY
jgi:hypothetical protein